MVRSSDPVFDSEQKHLREVHSDLSKTNEAITHRIEKIESNARSDRSSMMEDIRPDFTDASATIETLAAYEAANSIIKQHENERRINIEKAKAISLLLKRPYFAKLILRFPNRSKPREIYLGAVGFSDKEKGQLVYDWRSPVAEVYYSQSQGRVSYEANGKTIEADLDLRRQFKIDGSELIAYFDTDIALQDDLLIESLSRARSSRMEEITATIQKEQNAIVRAPDASAILVSGVAGSGKTSVMLQRLAYLFFQNRGSLKPENVVLITPNVMFQEYIENVLPELGEKNPRMHTWNSLKEEISGLSAVEGASLMPAEMLDLVKSELGKEEPAEACLEAENIRYVLIDEVQDYTLEQLNVIASYYCRARFLLLGDPNQALSEGLASFDEIRELFAKHKGSVSEAHLAISYRSTVEITRLFASFADLNEHLRIESIQRNGSEPRILECKDNDSYREALASEIERIVAGEYATESAAIITLQTEELERVQLKIAEYREYASVKPLDDIRVLTLEEAKGLEFDHVILVDVSKTALGETDLWRRRLYTAISRATKSFVALSRGPVSPLLAQQQCALCSFES